ncbi:ABC transporter ATP-binding protein [Actinomadura barringtoniae]|uniref:ABC transporter ATP-binding protein n=1 Tax=Actinomadura barringtoniae TaxID=1427535 RepID=A0A939PHL2_9ACTN|nr:ABC transporter ATP-binding protein [Actinomadura barringtoniae]MBO2452805.1 ABC transporter ATP-binding protein [Actinomadura barringtoniae]
MTASPPTPLLEVADLHVRIGGSHILQGIEFGVARDGVTALLGRNGVGKTTTLKAIMGLVRATGDISLDGTPINGTRTFSIVKHGVGYVPEDREVFGGLTVEENLRLAELGERGAHDDFVFGLFPELKKRSRQQAGTLSGGQQQMVALARVLINDHRLLLVDEPTKGLAPKVVGEVAEALRRAAEVATLVLVEQNIQIVRAIARDAIVLDHGQVVHTGSAAELLADEALTRRLLGVGRSEGAVA